MAFPQIKTVKSIFLFEIYLTLKEPRGCGKDITNVSDDPSNFPFEIFDPKDMEKFLDSFIVVKYRKVTFDSGEKNESKETFLWS